MIVHDAKELAGQFYEQARRSRKFRASWPNDKSYVELKWPHFVTAVREAYGALLGQKNVPEHDKQLMYQALIADAASGSNSEGASSPLPIHPNTEAFFGDRSENRKTEADFGTHGESLKALLRSSTALINRG